MIHCLHGAVGSFHAWETIRQHLRESIQAIDLWRFFDRSPHSLTAAGQSISENAKAGDVLLGYSMGGRLALHALLADPEKWQAAIIVSAHPGLNEGQAERRAKDRDWAQLADRDWSSFLREWNQQGILESLPEGMVQANFKDQNSVSQSFLHWSLGMQKDLRPDFPEITCPVLWITGDRDPKFTALAKEATELLPNSENLIIEESGHRVPWDQPGEFCSAVQNFLQRLTTC